MAASIPPGRPCVQADLYDRLVSPDADPAASIIERLQRVMAGDGTPEDAARAAAEVDGLFAANQDMVYATCLKLIGDPERARELAQEALLVAYRKLPEFRGDSKFRTWLYGIARNLSWRASTKRRELLVDDGLMEGEDTDPDALTRLRREERHEVLRQASAAVLDPLEQEAVYLRYVEQLPMARIEALLGLDTASGARGLLQRCRRKLAREIRRRIAELGHGTTSFLHGSV